MARQGSPGQRGEGEENGPTERSNGGSVQREQIYILINKTTICMTLEEVSAQRGSRMDKSGCGWGVIIRCKWQKGYVGIVRPFQRQKRVLLHRWGKVPHKHWEDVLFCFFPWETNVKTQGGPRMDAEMKKKKIMHFCTFVYQHDYFAWLSFLQALS